MKTQSISTLSDDVQLAQFAGTFCYKRLSPRLNCFPFFTFRLDILGRPCIFFTLYIKKTI